MSSTRKAINFIVPLLLVAAISFMVYLKIDTASQINKQAIRGNRAAAIIACDTVYSAGLDQHTFLVKSFGSSPKPQFQSFLDDLKSSVDTNHTVCLTRAQRLGEIDGKSPR